MDTYLQHCEAFKGERKNFPVRFQVPHVSSNRIFHRKHPVGPYANSFLCGGWLRPFSHLIDRRNSLKMACRPLIILNSERPSVFERNAQRRVVGNNSAFVTLTQPAGCNFDPNSTASKHVIGWFKSPQRLMTLRSPERKTRIQPPPFLPPSVPSPLISAGSVLTRLGVGDASYLFTVGKLFSQPQTTSRYHWHDMKDRQKEIMTPPQFHPIQSTTQRSRIKMLSSFHIIIHPLSLVKSVKRKLWFCTNGWHSNL